MFTGIIEAVGQIGKLERHGPDIRLTVNTGKLDLSDVKLGDSIATNGVCLTVVSKLANGFVADVSGETVRLTGFAHYHAGQAVNLEKAMQPQSRFGGHIVSGHVDGVAKVVGISPLGKATEYWLAVPSELSRYIAYKGSITVDGVSLTVNAVEGDRFKLTIVPHTASETIMPGYQVGSMVNIEVDVLARYLERLLQAGQALGMPQSGGVTMDLLASSGFLAR